MRRPSLALLLVASLGCDAASEGPAAATGQPAAATAPKSSASGAPSAAGTAAVAPSAAAAPSATTVEANVSYARSLVGQFGPALKQELMQGMSAGGPTNAITVCSEKAPTIAASLEVKQGWSIRRTSLKARNPKNAPDAWERKMLEKLEAQKAEGTPVGDLEISELVDGEFRYLKAIGTDALCLNCHGAELASDVVKALDALYPEDTARGYAVGDIRGAFTIRAKP